MRGNNLKSLRAAIAAACFAIPIAPASAEPRPESLSALTAKISADVGRLTNPEDLLDYPEFKAVFDRPAPRLKETLELLESSGPSDDQKVIAVYAMQKLSFDDCLAFDESLLKLLDAGKISLRVFENGGLPPLEWNTTLYENYRNPKVRAFLQKVKRSPKARKRRDYADWILSGQAAKEVGEQRRKGDLPK